jgi:hypothetical protein
VGEYPDEIAVLFFQSNKSDAFELDNLANRYFSDCLLSVPLKFAKAMRIESLSFENQSRDEDF